MHSLLEFARTLTPDLGPEGILKSVLRTIMGKGLITEGFAYLSLKEESLERRYRLLSRSGFRGIELPTVLTFEMIEAWMITPPEKTRFTLPIFDSEQQEIIGFLGFGKSLSPETDISTEQNYLESLSLLTGIALTNADLFEAEKQRERFEVELRLAREIQESLLPQSVPEIKGLSFTAFSRQSELVGGDYYDIIKLSDQRVLVAIADVVGKGISAAILMSSLQASLRALVTLLRSGQIGLKEMVEDLNRLVFESTTSARYITAVFAVVDAGAGNITSIVCGHPRPIICATNGNYSELPTNGIPLGVLGKYDFQPTITSFADGDYCAFYTDGLSEAISGGKMIGEKGVEVFLKSIEAKGRSSLALEEAIFRGSDLLVSDDVTLVIVRKQAEFA
ncbi:MAG: PP2C family protein-serine/threonine phosphatase [Bacteroidota bacterium]|nr:PP2C family protein-serine/threonine phosphatase [Bacteroidota bacterium]